ncbi:MAG: Asd/ArgC dimerization domain-containing protein [Sulfitobacter sp.]
MSKKLSIFGAYSLLGQHLLTRLSADCRFEIASLHDQRHTESRSDIAWLAGDAGSWLADEFEVLSPKDQAKGDIILSFLPDKGAEEIEAAHLAAGARIISHCEYAREKGALLVPQVCEPDLSNAPLIATPNCTTAMCALPLSLLHAKHGIEAAHITTLQAISGTDLPGMQAHQIHNQVVSDLPGEAHVLQRELNHVFANAFPVSCAATRVPVWRGHTMSLMIKLADGSDAQAAVKALEGQARIAVLDRDAPYPAWRREIESPDLLCTIEAIRDGQGGWITLSLRGDNLGAATTGVMLCAASMLCDVPI